MNDDDFDFDAMGIVRRGHHLLWGYKHGRLRWAPQWVREVVVTVWNWIACRLFGHDIIGPWEKQELEPWPDGTRAWMPAMPKTCTACNKVW